MKFDFDDILLEPSPITSISSRKEIDITDQSGYLPLFTAPMDTVVNDRNKDYFINTGIRVIIPRTVNLDITSDNTFKALGIEEFVDKYLRDKVMGVHYILIDVANGHMQKILEMTVKAKETYQENMILMVGNIAHPKTYELFSEAGADFIRIGIGNGGGCLTTVQTGIGYPMASLIHECYQISCTLKKPAKIVADGGFKNYSDIIKGLALGADYVMIGSILNKALESAGDTYLANVKKEGWTEPGEQVDQYATDTEKLFKYGTKMFKKFRGMSTKEAQKAMGKKILKTSEGISRMQPVEYTVDGWTENFKSYLSSAMSYCDAKGLSDFIGKAKWNLITNNALHRFKK
jgi:GMP reductase